MSDRRKTDKGKGKGKERRRYSDHSRDELPPPRRHGQSDYYDAEEMAARGYQADPNADRSVIRENPYTMGYGPQTAPGQTTDPRTLRDPILNYGYKNEPAHTIVREHAGFEAIKAHGEREAAKFEEARRRYDEEGWESPRGTRNRSDNSVQGRAPSSSRPGQRPRDNTSGAGATYGAEAEGGDPNRRRHRRHGSGKDSKEDRRRRDH